MDPLTIRVEDLLAPVSNQPGLAGRWSITLYPKTREQQSKTLLQDNTFGVGTTNPQREWLGKIAAALRASSGKRAMLFPVSPAQLDRIMTIGAQLTQLTESNRHRLRHGGASADGLAGVETSVIQGRGFWKSPKSVARYQKPGAYLRELAKLTPEQRRQAQEDPTEQSSDTVSEEE